MLHSIRTAVVATVAAGFIAVSAVAAQAGQPDLGAAGGSTVAPKPMGEDGNRCSLSRCQGDELPQASADIAQLPGSGGAPKPPTIGEEIPSGDGL
jgi:hypothetical protein